MKVGLYVWVSVFLLSAGCAIDPQVSLAQGRSGPSSATLEISGQASFLERIALAPDSYVLVSVVAQTPVSKVLAAQRLTSAGNPPYRFALDVDAEQWPESADVRLSIQVYSPEGQLQFHLPEPQLLIRGETRNLQIRLLRATANSQ